MFTEKKLCFFNVKFETLWYIYSMFPRKKTMFSQCEIWNSLVYILYVPKKKAMFFQCGIKKLFWFKYFNLKA
jgi:hypothetical protein